MVGKILVEIIRIVVVEVETLRGIALRFFGDTNHDDFHGRGLEFLDLVCLRPGLKECSVGKADPLAVRQKRWDFVPS